jgi:hypothetical protein
VRRTAKHTGNNRRSADNRPNPTDRPPVGTITIPITVAVPTATSTTPAAGHVQVEVAPTVTKPVVPPVITAPTAPAGSPPGGNRTGSAEQSGDGSGNSELLHRVSPRWMCLDTVSEGVRERRLVTNKILELDKMRKQLPFCKFNGSFCGCHAIDELPQARARQPAAETGHRVRNHQPSVLDQGVAAVGQVRHVSHALMFIGTEQRLLQSRIDTAWIAQVVLSECGRSRGANRRPIFSIGRLPPDRTLPVPVLRGFL